MKGYRFYEELENKNRKGEVSKGTVLAVSVEKSGRGYNPRWHYRAHQCPSAADCISSLYDEKNAPVCTSCVGQDYLREDTRRISEKRAREIHPRLFEYLERED